MPAILFDIDGTLLDSVDLHARAWQEAFLAFGKDIPFETIRSQIGKGGDQLAPGLLHARRARGARQGARALAQRLVEAAVHARGEAVSRACGRCSLALREPRLDARARLVVQGGRARVLPSGPRRGRPHRGQHERGRRRPEQAAPGHLRRGARSGPAARAARVLGGGRFTVGRARRVAPRAARRWASAPAGFPESDLRSAGVRMLFDGPADLLAHLDRSPFEDRR